MVDELPRLRCQTHRDCLKLLYIQTNNRGRHPPFPSLYHTSDTKNTAPADDVEITTCRAMACNDHNLSSKRVNRKTHGKEIAPLKRFASKRCAVSIFQQNGKGQYGVGLITVWCGIIAKTCQKGQQSKGANDTPLS